MVKPFAADPQVTREQPMQCPFTASVGACQVGHASHRGAAGEEGDEVRDPDRHVVWSVRQVLRDPGAPQ